MNVWQKHKKKVYIGIGAVVVGLLFTAAAVKIPQNQSTNQSIFSPTTSPVISLVLPKVSPTSQLNSSKCHAKQVDSTDPQAFLPDPVCTPGVINPAVTQANIRFTICKSGYTATIRPPFSYTEPLKLQSIQDYGYTDTNVKDFEEDHLISLELGGSPTDVNNLWAEPHSSPNEKDRVENYLHTQICDGQMTLSEAQTLISTNWYNVFKQAGL